MSKMLDNPDTVITASHSLNECFLLTKHFADYNWQCGTVKWCLCAHPNWTILELLGCWTGYNISHFFQRQSLPLMHLVSLEKVLVSHECTVGTNASPSVASICEWEILWINNALVLKTDFNLAKDQLEKAFLMPHIVCLESYVKAFQY